MCLDEALCVVRNIKNILCFPLNCKNDAPSWFQMQVKILNTLNINFHNKIIIDFFDKF